MKISLREMICCRPQSQFPHNRCHPSLLSPTLTFSCLKCFNSFNSRYVLLLKTGVEKGFMIFLMATAVPPNWSLAEQTRPKAPEKKRRLALRSDVRLMQLLLRYDAGGSVAAIGMRCCKLWRKHPMEGRGKFVTTPHEDCASPSTALPLPFTALPLVSPHLCKLPSRLFIHHTLADPYPT